MRVISLVLIVGIVYANAWHDSMVYDDKLFADYQRYAEFSAFPRYFTDHLWAERTTQSSLYRPVLFLSVGLDARLFGDWFTGYHGVNVLIHVLVTLLVYTVLLNLLRSDDRTRSSAAYAAFLAAVVYGVHPVHSEVVNSVFNRSTMLAAIGMLGGLTLLLRFIDSKPVLAWCGLLFGYTFALFSRETAVVLPGLVIVLLFTLRPGHAVDRLRKTIPVLLLLGPLLIYLVMRSNALSGGGFGPDADGRAQEIVNQLGSSRLLQPAVLLDAVATWGQGIFVFLWPFDLRLSYPGLTLAWQWAVVIPQLILLVAAWQLYRRGRKGLLVGLVFYYLAFVPASRLIGGGILGPHLQERYLYIPSIGLTLVLAYALAHLRRHFEPLLVAAPVVLFVLVSTPVIWARTEAWSDEIRLFESEYKKGARGEMILRLLTAAYLRQGDLVRVMEVCDADTDDRLEKMPRVSVHCASAYSYSGRIEDAERAYRAAARAPLVSNLAHSNFAQHYLRQGRRNDAEVEFRKAIEAERTAAGKAYRTGYMLVHLYPNSPEKLIEARQWFQEAARLAPQWKDPRNWLTRLNAALGPDDPGSKP